LTELVEVVDRFC